MPQAKSKETDRKVRRHGLDRDLVRLPRRGSLLAFLVGVACIGAAAGLRVLIETLGSGSIPHFITFYPLLSLIGFLCGARIGVPATAAAALLVWYVWMPPRESWDLPDRASIISLGLFLALGSFTAWIGAWARSLFEKVQTARLEHDRIARETVHRLKNLIAVVQGLSHQSARGADSVPGYRADLDARLTALARAQDLVLNGGGASPGIAKLVEAAAGPFRDSPHFEASGEGDFTVPEPIHLGLALALGELGANSLKYGALAGKGGKARLTWREEAGRRIVLWREDTAVVVSDRKGFGSRLIASALDRLPGAKVDYAVAADGVTCRFEWGKA